MLKDLPIILIKAILSFFDISAKSSDRGVRTDNTEGARLVRLDSSMLPNFRSLHGWHEGSITNLVHDFRVELDIWVNFLDFFLVYFLLD